MTYKTLTAMHEIRLSIVQIGIPVAIGLIYLHEHPEITNKLKDGCKKIGNKIRHPFKKKDPNNKNIENKEKVNV